MLQGYIHWASTDNAWVLPIKGWFNIFIFFYYM